jgi:hypothetical protein
VQSEPRGGARCKGQDYWSFDAMAGKTPVTVPDDRCAEISVALSAPWLHQK